MNSGKICQEGTPIDIYQSPANIFVHEFLGESNRVVCHVTGRMVQADDGFALGDAAAPDGPAQAFIRPHHVVALPNPRGIWAVSRIAATGAHARISVTRDATTLDASMTADALLDSGLVTGLKVDVFFTGGTIFTADGTGPIKLGALKPAVIQLRV